MSPPSRIPVTVAILIVGLALLAGWGLPFVWRGDDARLNLVRQDVHSIFSATTPVARGQHANACLRMAEPLARKTGCVGSTATLFLLGAAPLVKFDTSKFSFPSESQLQEIATDDLLMSTRLLFNSRHVGLADQLVELVLSRDDANREEILRLAITVRYEIGRDDDVLNHCDEVITLHPDDPGIYHVKAMVHRNRGHWENFIDVAEKGLELLRNGGDVPDIDVVELIDGYLRLGRTADARREFDALSRRKSDLIAHEPVLQAKLLIQEGSQEQAVTILDEVLSKKQDDGEAMILKGTLLIGRGQYDEAVEVLRRAVVVAPAEEQAYYQLGQAHARRGEHDLAQDFLKKHRTLLDAKVRLHQLEQKAEKEPHNVDIRMEIAGSYAKIGLNALADFWTRAARAAAE